MESARDRRADPEARPRRTGREDLRRLDLGFPPVTPTTSPSRTVKLAERVCVICGDPIVHRSEATRHCSAACRVEASRIRAILAGNYSGPYRSVRERLEAAERGVQRALPRRKDGDADGR
jgi:hypothetical protein